MSHPGLLIFLISSLLFLEIPDVSNSQIPDLLSKKPDSVYIHKGRLIGSIGGESAVYLGSIGGLSVMWYKDYPQTSFHFFNDDNEWQLMDKAGHSISAYYICRFAYASVKWSGVNEKLSVLYAGLLGFTYLANIEILDGFSSEWGFSPGDLAANTFGCVLFSAQQLGWHEQRFMLKYSYHNSNYAQYRPDLLGDNLIQNILKDYNGQTFWVSANIGSFLPKSSKFPKWLNVSLGYGAEGMLGGTVNPEEYKGNPLPEFDRYRKYFLTMDVDLSRIPTRSKLLKGVFNFVNFIKVPCPALEYNSKGQFKFHSLYF
ncbi:MAG: DUF2279 domain-containing protein [Bacteroidota bacterium]|nr:DUF2279 domain-containing protein [Bacteroidota bacterium]